MTRYDHTSARTGDGTDIWCTPRDLIVQIERYTGFNFVVDLAANAQTARFPIWIGPGSPYCVDACSMTGMDVARLVPFDPSVKRPAVWCNPPYSRLTPDRWPNLICEIADHIPIVALVPTRPETRWAQMMVEGCDMILCPRRRIAFERPDGTRGKSPPGATWAIVRTPSASLDHGEIHYLD